MIILCTHNDGGVGKTTLAVHAVGALQSQLGRILLIDCDDQADSWQFYSDGIPKKLEDVLVKDDISLIWNKNRESIKRLAKPEQYSTFHFHEVHLKLFNSLLEKGFGRIKRCNQA